MSTEDVGRDGSIHWEHIVDLEERSPLAGFFPRHPWESEEKATFVPAMSRCSRKCCNSRQLLADAKKESRLSNPREKLNGFAHV